MSTNENYWSTPLKVQDYIQEISDEVIAYSAFFIRLVEKLIRDEKNFGRDLFIDLGCGPGITSATICEYFSFRELLAVDLSQAMLDVVPLYVDTEKTIANTQCGDLAASAFDAKDNTADLIISSSSLSYVKTLVNVLKESARVLKTGGLLLFDSLIHSEPIFQSIVCEDREAPMTTYAHSSRFLLFTANSLGLKTILNQEVGIVPDYTNIQTFRSIFAFKK